MNPNEGSEEKAAQEGAQGGEPKGVQMGEQKDPSKVAQSSEQNITPQGTETGPQKTDQRRPSQGDPKQDNANANKEDTEKTVKDYNNINDMISYIIKVGVWEMYTYEWLMNRKTFLYYNTYVENYFFYDKNNNLTPFNEKYFFLYVITFDNTDFVASFFFKKNEKKNNVKKIKLSSYTKTMQGRRKKQEDRYTVINDMTKYIDAYDYKTLFFYKRNPFYCFSVIDGHRGIKACEYCMTHIVKNIIYYFYNQDNVRQDEFKLGSSSATKDNKQAPSGGESCAEKGSTHKREVQGTTAKGQTQEGIQKDENKRCDDSSSTGCSRQDSSTGDEKKDSPSRSNTQESEKEEGRSKDKRVMSKEQISKTKKRRIDSSDITESEENPSERESEDDDKKRNGGKVSPDSDGNFRKEKDECNPTSITEDKAKTTIANTSAGGQKKLVFLEDLTDEEIMNCIKLAFLRTDEQFLKISKFPNHGCTVISLIVIKNKMFIANLGDCRAIGIVNVNNTLKAEMLSQDHKPNEPRERERIKKMGGEVICMQNVFRVKANAKKTTSDPSNLLDRLPMKEEVYLAVSRAIGDKDFKENNVVSALPDVVCRELCDGDKGNKESENENENETVECSDPTVRVQVEENYFKEGEPFFFSPDEMNYLFVVLACDGVWDTLSNKDVAQILQTYQHDPDKACSEIIKTAFACGSQDNITAILLKFY
ncbi:Protein phosphatase 2c [Plasmodium coatneyi]|uniref:Protein phosphatase 2c n=1 Tax=Plasmodium coatneyi TaxID=208452 RepID=A0A1B1E0V5_9APIC|nr:Protein phosphatase 2c [Plasmodium coatneyi]ANQ08515.1 Protein phosphatase 2c [Plasmodium coatneyi]